MGSQNSWYSESTVQVAKGGTGIATQTAYSVLCAGTTATGAMQSLAAIGSSGQVLTSNGAAALPTWQDNAATSAAWQLVSSQSPSGAASADFTDLAAEAIYQVIYRITNGTNSEYLTMLVSLDNGSNWDVASYNSGCNTFADFTSNVLTNTNSTTEIILSSIASSSRNITGRIYVKAGTYCHGWGDGLTQTTTTTKRELTQFYRASSSAVDAIRFIASAGTITGTVSLYKQVIA